MHASTKTRSIVLLAIAVAMAGCLPGAAMTPAPRPGVSPGASPRPIIIDADMDHSDLVAIALLLREWPWMSARSRSPGPAWSIAPAAGA